jgi:hypothetical protein
MSPLALSSVIFVTTLGGIFLGTLLRRALPKHHLSKESQDIVKLGAGLIATIAALVLGHCSGKEFFRHAEYSNQAGRSTISLRFRSGFTPKCDRKPTPGMAKFGVLEPPLRPSVLNRGTDFDPRLIPRRPLPD